MVISATADAKPAASSEPPLEGADAVWGFRFGADGAMGLDEACQFLGGISRYTLDRKAKAGLLRKGKHPGSKLVMYCRRAIQVYLANAEI